MENLTIVEGIAAARPRQPRRFGILYGLMGIVAAVLVGRSFYLQIWHGSLFLQAAEGNRVAIHEITAPRGIIYDHHGKQLVENVASTDLVLDPTLLPGEEYEAPLIEQLPAVVGVTAEDVRIAIQNARQKQRPQVVARALDHDVVLRLEETKDQLPGIRLVSSLVRKYPYSLRTAHVVGYTGAISSEELADHVDYSPTDITGKTAVEKQYDEILHGKHGAQLREVNAAGQIQKELGTKPPVAGSNLTLALDYELQEYIYQLFTDRRDQATQKDGPPVSGSVVALDPRTGAVRALVSYPSYDPNIFSQPALQGTGTQLFKDPQQPLFNRGIDGEYPPGSTIKPFLAAAGLEERVITPQTTVVSTGMVSVGQWRFPDWKSGGHGVTSLNKAIAESVNTFFYLLAGGDGQRQGLGVVKIKHYLEKFGWGESTGIDLPNEAAGFLPSPQWKEEVKHERWYIGDTYHLGIGQGDVLASPLQVAVATMGIANNGKIFQPYLIEKIAPPDRAEQLTAATHHTLPIKAAHLAVVKSAMRSTVTEGSGRALSTLPVAVAGKTGTAQIGGTQDTHAWFTSFGPYDQPNLVVTVLLERAGEGDDEAAPFAKKIWEWWGQHRS